MYKQNPVTVSESDVGRLCVYWDEYKSNRYLHIRYFYEDKSDGEWKPSGKGIGIPSNNVVKVLEAIQQVLEEKAEATTG